MNKVYFGDNLEILRKHIPDESIDLIYIDPPFNTKKKQTRTYTKTIKVSEEGDSELKNIVTGYQGNKYKKEEIVARSYNDSFEDYLEFLRPRIKETHRVLKPNGSFYFHIDYREVHYCKVMIDEIFGRDNFINEIIWAYDYGARSKSRWPAKHDNILFYAKNKDDYVWNYDQIDRIPYLAPGLVGKEKAARGKTLTDTWFHTIVPTNGKEKVNYPTQKPLGILRRIVKVSSPKENGIVMDFFGGSGSFAHAAVENGRQFITMDSNPEAIEVMKKRFKSFQNVIFV